jgi:hypothetical protein
VETHHAPPDTHERSFARARAAALASRAERATRVPRLVARNPAGSPQSSSGATRRGGAITRDQAGASDILVAIEPARRRECRSPGCAGLAAAFFARTRRICSRGSTTIGAIRCLRRPPLARPAATGMSLCQRSDGSMLRSDRLTIGASASTRHNRPDPRHQQPFRRNETIRDKWRTSTDEPHTNRLQKTNSYKRSGAFSPCARPTSSSIAGPGRPWSSADRGACRQAAA